MAAQLVRRWIEMVGVLHKMGHGQLRLACGWANAGPGPVWFGDVAPTTYFRRDNGALLAKDPRPGRVQVSLLPNAIPMFTSRRAASTGSHPWPGFRDGTAEDAAVYWLSLYSKLADEGKGEDPAYVDWYSKMLKLTAPNGIIAAWDCWQETPDYVFVSCSEIDRIESPPPGEADEGEFDANRGLYPLS